MSLDRVTDEILALLREIEGRAEPLPCTDEIVSLLHAIIDGEVAPVVRHATVVPAPAVVTPARVVQWAPSRPDLPLGDPVARFFRQVAWDGTSSGVAFNRPDSSIKAPATPRSSSVRQFFAAVRWDGGGTPGSFTPETTPSRAGAAPTTSSSGDAASVRSFFGSVRWEGASATPS